jgi:mono/diheme cytochrome c family protein
MKASTIVVVIILLLSFAACSSSPSSPVPSPSPTFGDLSNTGQTVYATNCGSCHSEGGAPALWGTNANLIKYNTAQGLLNYIAAYMPAGSPGSLSHQDYLDVLSYLLIKNNDVISSVTFNENQLGSIMLK